jgi:hypothetical protein
MSVRALYCCQVADHAIEQSPRAVRFGILWAVQHPPCRSRESSPSSRTTARITLSNSVAAPSGEIWYTGSLPVSSNTATCPIGSLADFNGGIPWVVGVLVGTATVTAQGIQLANQTNQVGLFTAYLLSLATHRR